MGQSCETCRHYEAKYRGSAHYPGDSGLCHWVRNHEAVLRNVPFWLRNSADRAPLMYGHEGERCATWEGKESS